MIPSQRLPHRLAMCLVATAALAGCANGGPKIASTTPTQVAAQPRTSSPDRLSAPVSTSMPSTVASVPVSSGPAGASTTVAGGVAVVSSTVAGSARSTGTTVAVPNAVGTGSGPAATTAPVNTVATTNPPAPQVRTWTVAYGSPPPTFTAHLGDEIVLKISSATEQEFHVHPPYDIVLSGTPVVTFDFVADQPGAKIVVESHTNPGVVVCYLTVT